MTLIRKATTTDNAKRLADAHRKQIGFVMRPALQAAIERGELLEAVIDDAVIGFAHFHVRRDGWTTLYEIVSTSAGGGRALLSALPRPLRLKCPVDNHSNGLYEHMGGPCSETVSGRKRDLHVWIFL